MDNVLLVAGDLGLLGILLGSNRSILLVVGFFRWVVVGCFGIFLGRNQLLLIFVRLCWVRVCGCRLM